MRPIVAEVENVDELLSGLETSKLDNAVVLDWLIILPVWIWHPDASTIGKLEFMEM